MLLEGEFGFCTDTTEIYIGSAAGNVLVASGEFAVKIENLIKEISGKLTASKAQSVEALATDSDVAAAVNAINSLIASLKTAGIME